MSTSEYQGLPRRSLRVLLFPLWHNNKSTNKISINQHYHSLASQKRCRIKMRNPQSFELSKTENQNELNLMFDDTPLRGKMTVDNVRNVFFRCRKMYEASQTYLPRFTTRTIKYVGFLAMVDKLPIKIVDPNPEARFYTINDVRDLSFVTDNQLTDKLEAGTIVKVLIHLAPKDLETYVVSSDNLAKTSNYIKEVFNSDFSFLSYPYLDDLTIAERALLPDWLSNLLNIMQLYPFRESAFHIRPMIPSVSSSAFIQITIRMFAGKRKRSYFLWSFAQDPSTFAKVLPIERTYHGDYSDLIHHIADNSVKMTFDSIDYDINNMKFTLSVGKCDLNPLNELESTRLLKWVGDFKSGCSLQLIGNKGCGKSTLIRGMYEKFPHVLCVDSDEFGIFLHMLIAEYPYVLNDDLTFISEEDFDPIQFELTLSAYLQIRDNPDDTINGSIFEKVMTEIFVKKYEAHYNPKNMELIMDDYNHFFHSAISHPSFGFRMFFTELVEHMFSTGKYTQYVHFVHCYSELGTLPHCDEYLTLFSNIHFNPILRKHRSGHYTAVITQLILLSKYYCTTFILHILLWSILLHYLLYRII
ncbi:P9 [Oat sterile dwarf virus]|uniref:p9 n=1 Tax=Oat sterile dwarf virus TaxID=73147 RepID=O70787_9REOV|nr:P9 [Oat sterile dwarf virus]BAA25151.1 P9 [Oat sterile dwarf virus]